jgi:predicted neuraminidase
MSLAHDAHPDFHWVLKEIAADMERDAEAFDGQPFNGRTVAEYFGNHGAAVAVIARIVDGLIRRIERLEEAGADRQQGATTK